jgi:hypothetical protein
LIILITRLSSEVEASLYTSLPEQGGVRVRKTRKYYQRQTKSWVNADEYSRALAKWRQDYPDVVTYDVSRGKNEIPVR